MASTMPTKMTAKLLLYIAFLLHPKYPSYFFPAYMYFIYIQLRRLKSFCDVIPCPIHLIQHYINTHSEIALDVNNTVILSKKVANDLKKNTLNLAFINSQGSNDDFRIVQTLTIPDIEENDMLMSENLYHNINKTKNVNKMRLTSINVKHVKIAKEVEIALINAQCDISNDIVDVLLKNYFQIPRLLYKHDVFSINLNEYAPEIVCSNIQLSDIENIYFKCKKVSSEQVGDSVSGLFCVNGESTLLQSANVRCYLPLSIFKLCDSDNLSVNVKYEDCLISKCPYGLQKYMKDIEKAVVPFIPKSNISSLKPAFLIQGRKGIGKNSIIGALASKLGVQIYKAECSDIQTNTPAQTESKLRNIFMKSKLCAPCFLILNNFEIFGKDSDGNYDPRLINYFQTEIGTLFDNNNFPIVLLCLSNTKELSSDLTRTFLETFEIEAPTQAERNDLLRWLMLTRHMDSETPLSKIAAKTHGFLLGDLDALISHAEKNLYVDSDITDSKICLRKKNFDKALDLMQTSYSTSLGAPKVPKVLWSDVGGLQDLKHEIMRTINLPLQHPQLLKTIGLKRSGILLYGPPGTGKTLIAKAVATECGLCFLSVKGPELLNMYVGQSEQNVRQVFERAREASPCIIFFDELDSLAPNRGISGDSGGVMDRVVSQLLSEMDGLNDATKTVFVIGATNRPDLLDPALLRPGRFDKLLYVGPCSDNNSKTGVLQALTRKFTLSEDVKLDKIASLLPANITGADMYAVCSNAWFSAVRKTIQTIEKDEIDNEDLSAEMVTVTMKDFTTAAKEIKVSINEEDMKYFQMLKQQISTAK